MKHTNPVVPNTIIVQVERKDRCGRVPGLDDDELADPEELERQVIMTELEPLFSLSPKRGGWQTDPPKWVEALFPGHSPGQ